MAGREEVRAWLMGGRGPGEWGRDSGTGLGEGKGYRTGGGVGVQARGRGTGLGEGMGY